MSILLDSFQGDLTPTTRFESSATYFKWPFDIYGHHKIIDGKALCASPDRSDYGSSLESQVTCQHCRDLWSFRVNAEYWRTNLIPPISKDLYTRLHDINSCNCDSCNVVMRQILSGKDLLG